MTNTRLRGVFVALLFCGVAGVVLSLLVTLEKISLLIDPNHVSACNVNKFISCTSVISSPESQMFFDIPNSLFGLVGFTFLASFGVFGLAFKNMPQWTWYTVSIGLLLATIFCVYLSWVTFFVIGAMCIYCVSVWLVTTFAFCVSLRVAWQNTCLRTIGFYNWMILGIAVIWYVFAAIWGLFLL